MPVKKDTTVRPLPEPTQEDADRFWSKVDKTPGQGPQGRCWRFLGAISKPGYGQFKLKRKQVKAHRVAFRLEYGADPFPCDICHMCDMRWCCNPECFFLGDTASYTADSKRKGRRACGDRNGKRTHPEKVARGEDNPQAKQTKESVLEAVRLYRSGLTLKQVAAINNVDFTTIASVLSGKTWSHVTGIKS